MKITVVGAGAVGGYFGGRLAEAGLDVTFLVRKRRAEQLSENGLIIESPFGNAQFSAQIATSAEEIGACDLVLLSVKNYHLEQVVETVRTLCDRGAKVLPLLNGVEHFDVLTRELGAENVLGGLCYIISTLDSEGKIEHTNQQHRVTFGPLVPEQAQFCHDLDELVRNVNSNWVLSGDILADIWNKYIFITAFSGVTTVSRLPIDEVLTCEPTAHAFRQVLMEMTRLSQAKGAIQPDGLVETMIEQSKNLPHGATSSMHQDFRKGLPLEVENLQGAAVRIAREAGIAVPVLETIYGLLKPFELPREPSARVNDK